MEAIGAFERGVLWSSGLWWEDYCSVFSQPIVLLLFWLCTRRPPFPRPTCSKFYFLCCNYNRIADLKASHRTEYLVKRQPKNRVPRKTTATEQDRIGQKAPLGTKNLNSFLHSCQQDIKSISLLLLILHLLNKTNRFIILIRTTTTRSSKLW